MANSALANAEALTVAAAIARDRLPPRTLVKTVIRYNPGGESAMFLLPGTIAYVLALVSVLVTALAIARLGMFDVLLVLAVGAAVFALPFRGSLPLVGLASTLFLVGMLGQGLLVSIVTRSQMLATQLGAVSAVLPSLLLSGFLFPVENLPWPLYWLSMIVPARFLVGLLRGTLLKGSGWSDHWIDLVALAAFALLTVVASAALFRRRVA
jgi:ABC-2 type transport system permease protein